MSSSVVSAAAMISWLTSLGGGGGGDSLSLSESLSSLLRSFSFFWFSFIRASCSARSFSSIARLARLSSSCFCLSSSSFLRFLFRLSFFDIFGIRLHSFLFFFCVFQPFRQTVFFFLLLFFLFQ